MPWNKQYLARGNSGVFPTDLLFTLWSDKHCAKYSREKFEKDPHSYTFHQFDSRNLIILNVQKVGGRGSPFFVFSAQPPFSRPPHYLRSWNSYMDGKWPFYLRKLARVVWPDFPEINLSHLWLSKKERNRPRHLTWWVARIFRHPRQESQSVFYI